MAKKVKPVKLTLADLATLGAPVTEVVPEPVTEPIAKPDPEPVTPATEPIAKPDPVPVPFLQGLRTLQFFVEMEGEAVLSPLIEVTDSPGDIPGEELPLKECGEYPVFFRLLPHGEWQSTHRENAHEYIAWKAFGYRSYQLTRGAWNSWDQYPEVMRVPSWRTEARETAKRIFTSRPSEELILALKERGLWEESESDWVKATLESHAAQKWRFYTRRSVEAFNATCAALAKHVAGWTPPVVTEVTDHPDNYLNTYRSWD